jgi:dihydrofolate synthase/folylpolyglutamate synthase
LLQIKDRSDNRYEIAGDFGKEYIDWPYHGPKTMENLRTAIASFELLFGYANIQFIINRAVSIISNPLFYTGRWTILSRSPMVIADSAHNVPGLQAVISKLISLTCPLHIVLGFVKDKAVDEILHLFPKDAQYYFVQAKVPRAFDAITLKEKAMQIGMQGKSYTSVKRGVAAAKRRASQNETIFVGGSTFIVADAI